MGMLEQERMEMEQKIMVDDFLGRKVLDLVYIEVVLLKVAGLQYFLLDCPLDLAY
jgi:hypothetical protein